MQETGSHHLYVFKPFPGSSHSWALEKLAALRPALRVLDFGAGSGAIGQILKESGFQNLSAVEIDEGARAHIGAFYDQVKESLDGFRGEEFDVIFALDVLEHLPDSFSAFASLCGMLAPGGKLLVSVPNIAHWSVRLPLMLGIFNCRDRGILDKTHLQFFTRRRFVELVNSVPGVHPAELDVSIEPAELVLPSWVWDNSIFKRISRLRLRTARIFPGLLAYQHLALLKKDE